jgi:hypothetical protein
MRFDLGARESLVHDHGAGLADVVGFREGARACRSLEA